MRTSLSAARSFALAVRINLVWKAPETGIGMILRMSKSSLCSRKYRIASVWPAIVTIFGQRYADTLHTGSSISFCRFRWFRAYSQARLKRVVDLPNAVTIALSTKSHASCIACDRTLISRTAFSNETEPAKTSAAYSPTL